MPRPVLPSLALEKGTTLKHCLSIIAGIALLASAPAAADQARPLADILPAIAAAHGELDAINFGCQQQPSPGVELVQIRYGGSYIPSRIQGAMSAAYAVGQRSRLDCENSANLNARQTTLVERLAEQQRAAWSAMAAEGPALLHLAADTLTDLPMPTGPVDYDPVFGPLYTDEKDCRRELIDMLKTKMTHFTMRGGLSTDPTMEIGSIKVGEAALIHGKACQFLIEVQAIDMESLSKRVDETIE